ncbi:MAG TPA: amidohydrolase [Actinomycetota bacterium]|nr:amidohydrolase [Actinomycetota bacterium]
MRGLLIRNAKVWTVDPAMPTAEAVAIQDDRIVAVGTDREAIEAAGTGAEEVDAGGNTVLPGFVDAHNHLRAGGDPDAVKLGDARTLEEVRAAIDAHAVAHPEQGWIIGEGWNYAALPDRRRPTARDLDGLAPGRAVMVFSYDVHTVWLNREAMERFGIADAGALPFGRIERDAATGEPTGFLTDFAVMGLSRVGQAALAEQVPNFAPDAVYRTLSNSLDMAAELGITTAVEPQNSVDDVPLFVRARGEGRLRSRVIAALFHPPGTTAEELDAFAEAKRTYDDDRFRVGPIKLYIDDVIEPHTAAMLEPYANAPERRGETFYPPEDFAALIVELERRGFQTFTHATGDRGIRTALDAVAHARAVNGPRDARHQIVHVECVHPDDLPRFAELGMVACMQPRHCAPEIVQDWRANVGPQRWPFAWPFRSLQAAGATLAFSSDWNVAEMDPLVWLYSACTRADLDGGESWVPEETLDLPAAIRAGTLGSAFANFAEGDRGSLTPGKYADVVVLSRDVFAQEPAALLETMVETTILGGEVVHRRT